MFTTRNPSEAVAAGSGDRGDAAYGPSSVDSSTRRKKQNVLWMELSGSVATVAVQNSSLIARQDKGGSMAF
jgi:hypothetical protein